MNIHTALRAPAVRRAPQPLARALAGAFAAGALGLGAAPASAITVYDITLVGLYDAGHTRSDGYQSNYAPFLNASGQVAGIAQRYNGSTQTGSSAWLYSGGTTQEIGLNGAGHTRSDGWQSNDSLALNAAGQVAGRAQRYSGSIATGQSAWLYSGGTTQEIGLTGAGHTRSDGYQINYTQFLNDAGQVAGGGGRYNSSIATGQSAWLYSGGITQEIGLTGAGHTNSSTGYQSNNARALNAVGQVAGDAQRYNGSTDSGRSTWLHSGGTTQVIGLTGAGHTRSDGYQVNDIRILNDAGQVVGSAQRYNGSIATGQSAWLHSSGTTQEIGLTGAGHTRSDGYQGNTAISFNASGQVAGWAWRYNGSIATGQSAWLYSSGTTQEIGLTGAGYTDSSTGYQSNASLILNDAGQVAGSAQRYRGSTDAGRSAWLYSGGITQEIGLTGVGYTRGDGYQFNNVGLLNDAGQVAGAADRYNDWEWTGLPTGQSAWLYDPFSNETYSMDGSVSLLTGEVYSSIEFLGDDGLALGRYTLFDDGGASLGDRAFSFTVADGWNDLGSLVNGGLNDAGWSYLATAYRANGAGQVVGNGVLAGMNGQAAYLLTPVPEPETWAMLVAGLALVGTAARRRRVALAAS